MDKQYVRFMDAPENLTPLPLTGGHTIGVVSERSGLSRHVLRVWERRYGAIRPDRTEGGQRLYSDEQLSRSMLLAEATRHGRSIRSVAGLSRAELERMLHDDRAAARDVVRTDEPQVVRADSAAVNMIVERALAHTLALDGEGVSVELRLALARSGLPLLIEQIVPMLMYRIGEEWMAQRMGIAHEHLTSAVVLGILLDALRSFPDRPRSPLILVATPAGEQHVIGAALIAVAAAVAGWRVRYLGANMPAADLAIAAGGARAVALSLVASTNDDQALREVNGLRQLLPSTVSVLLGGVGSSRLRSKFDNPGVVICPDIRTAESVLQSMH